MRKCGGSTIRLSITRYANKNRLNFIVDEGYPFGTNLSINADEILKNKQITKDYLLITNLRNPVTRLWSLFLDHPENKKMTLKFFLNDNIDFIPDQKNWRVTSNYFIKALLNITGPVAYEDYKRAINLLLLFDCIYILDSQKVLRKPTTPSIKLVPPNRVQKQLNYDRIKIQIEENRALGEKLNFWDIQLYNYFLVHSF